MSCNIYEILPEHIKRMISGFLGIGIGVGTAFTSLCLGSGIGLLAGCIIAFGGVYIIGDALREAEDN